VKKLSGFISFVALTSLVLPTAAMAGTYQCERAGVASVFTSNGTPRGNWLPIHNTSNWRYVAVPGGNDIYQHNWQSKTIQTLCKRDVPSSWNLGDRYNDYNGSEDACGIWSQAIPAASTSTNPCSTGFYKSGDQGSCIKPAVSAATIDNGSPRGNWTTQNTANYTYVEVAAGQGDDFYRHTGRLRSNVISTLCKRSGVLGFGDWDLGDRINDAEGLRDTCVTTIAAQLAVTVAASCPAGFTYTYKP
jgi:hypothetical protein